MKKIVVVFLMCCAMGLNAMAPNPTIKAESDLLWAIKNKDLQGAQVAVEKAGAPLNEIKLLLGYRGIRPLENAYGSGAYTIADYLISKGADASVLNHFLLGEANAGNVEKVDWLLKHGAKDVNDEALKEAKDMEADEPFAQLKAQYTQIIKLLENAKKTPVKLAPKIKPAAAKPVAQPIKEQPKLSDAAQLQSVVNEQELYNALETGSIATIKRLLDQGLNPDYVFTQGSFKADTPLMVLLNRGKYDQSLAQIGDLLFAKGAKKDAGMRFGLAKSVDKNNVELVRWFLNQGTKDYQNEIIDSVNFRLKNPSEPLENKPKLTQIKQLLEGTAGQPVRLTPMAKPIAKPAAMQPK